MPDIEGPVSRQGRHHDPEAESEADHRCDHESEGGDQLWSERLGRSGHDCEEIVVGGDHDQDGRVERPISFETYRRGEGAYDERQSGADEIFHDVSNRPRVRGSAMPEPARGQLRSTTGSARPRCRSPVACSRRTHRRNIQGRRRKHPRRTGRCKSGCIRRVGCWFRWSFETPRSSGWR